MKSIIPFSIALMMMAAVAFSSCVQTDKLEKEAYQESIQYSMTLPVEVFEFADVAVTYVGDHGILVTDTVTRGQTVPIWEAVEMAYLETEADQRKSEDTTKVVWQKSVMADSIPARVFISPRFLSKPCAKENEDKKYDLTAYMGYLYDTGVEVNELSASYNDSIRPHVRMGKQECFFHCSDVSGSKIATVMDNANHDPVTLDFTIRRVNPDSPKLNDYKNE
jgi:hypothetical protein